MSNYYCPNCEETIDFDSLGKFEDNQNKYWNRLEYLIDRHDKIYCEKEEK